MLLIHFEKHEIKCDNSSYCCEYVYNGFRRHTIYCFLKNSTSYYPANYCQTQPYTTYRGTVKFNIWASVPVNTPIVLRIKNEDTMITSPMIALVRVPCACSSFFWSPLEKRNVNPPYRSMIKSATPASSNKATTSLLTKGTIH